MKELRLHRALLAAALFGVAALAQTPTPPPQPTFRTEANYVRVDAYPTTGDGVPVTDLTQADFEILEGGAPQTIEQFERVVVRAAGPQDTRIEPNTVRESRAMAEQSKARLFVLFLDTYHVDIGASHAIRKPLIDALDRVIGQDDLVAVMTPEMSAADIAFARRTTTIERIPDQALELGRTRPAAASCPIPRTGPTVSAIRTRARRRPGAGTRTASPRR